MKTDFEIAIVGYGFVGAAVDAGFSLSCEKYIIDPCKFDNKVEDLNSKDIKVSFVCVPTPMSKDSSIDDSILKETVEKLLKYTRGIVAIKSTVTPDLIKELTTNNQRVIYNPEFLTERNYVNDFIDPIMHVFGGDKDKIDELETFYQNHSLCNMKVPIYKMSGEEASFVKYTMNTYLMSKVLWFNQLYDLVKKFGSCDYNTIIEAVGTDPRIGSSHTKVPGHDGRRGAGGSCFAKDGPAFVKFSKKQGTELSILKEILRRNQVYRNSYSEPLQREREQHIHFNYEF